MSEQTDKAIDEALMPQVVARLREYADVQDVEGEKAIANTITKTRPMTATWREWADDLEAHPDTPVWRLHRWVQYVLEDVTEEEAAS